jgi:addiction module HigA family antidote
MRAAVAAELGISATALAHTLGVPPNHIYQILSGGRALTADTALRLSQWLGTSAELWMNLQKLYELRLAEQQSGEEIKRTVARWQRTVARWQPSPDLASSLASSSVLTN